MILTCLFTFEQCIRRRLGLSKQCELKLSTMSSDTGYLTESFSNNTYKSETPNRKSDFKPYENSGAEHGVPERNAGYADLNDIGLHETQPYDNNGDRLGQEEPDKTVTRCRRRNCVISIISVAVLAGSGIVLCLLLICKLPGINCIIPPPPPPPPPPRPAPGCTVLRGAPCHFQYNPTLRNTREIRLIKETVNGKVTLFNVTDLTNDTNEIIYDQTNKMNFTVSVQDTEIEVTVHISDTQCSHHGNYNILAISDENGFNESFWRVNVIAPCPCQLDLNITSTGTITCSFPNAEYTSVIIQKVSGDKQKVLVNGSEIICPIGLQTTNGFSATCSKDGIIDIKLVLGRLDCSHEGDYNITVTMNGTSTVYEVYLHVIDYPQKPMIAVEIPGITENQGGRISCGAMIGCSKTQFEFELSGSGNDLWEIWRGTNSASPTLTDLGWKNQSRATVSIDQVKYVDKRKFRCSYIANGEIFSSPALCVGVIPANFCGDKIGGCNYQHPYLCNRYITCTSTTNPLERLCNQPDATELHFVSSVNCQGDCLYPREANCTTKNYCA